MAGSMQQFGVVLNQLIGMAVMMAVGVICVKTKLLNEKSLNGICQLILKVGIPMLVFANAVSGTTCADLLHSSAMIGLTLLLYALLIASMWLLAKLLRVPGERGRLFQGAFIFGNAGFIGLPLVLALFPERGALYFALMSLVDQCLLWTYGVWITKPLANRSGRFDERPARSWLQRVSSLISPALVAVALSIAVILLGVDVPEQILSPIRSLGGISTPLSMLYLGGLLVLRKWTSVLRCPELYVGIAFKMVAIPVAFCALLTYAPLWFGLPQLNVDMVHMIALIAGLPTMSALVMFAEREHNMPQYAVGMVLVTTIASLFTLSAVSYMIF